MRRIILCMLIVLVFLSQSLTEALGMHAVHASTSTILSIKNTASPHSHTHMHLFTTFFNNKQNLNCTDVHAHIHTHCSHALDVLLNHANFIPKLARLKQVFEHGDSFRFTSAITAPLDRPNWLTLFNFLH